MDEHLSSLNVEADIKSVAYLMDQRVINARLDRLESSNARLERLESSLEGISRAMDSLTRSVDRLLHAQAIGVSGSGSDAQMPASSPSFCHHQQDIRSEILTLFERLTKDQEEKEHEKNEEAPVIQKKKEEAADLYTIIKVARDEDLAQQIGRDIYFDLVDHGKVKCFSVKKQTPFNHFKEEVAKEFGIPVQFLRFWLWGLRQNQSYRPWRPLTPLEETKPVWQLRGGSKKAHNEELQLFLEVDLGLDLRPIVPLEKTEDDILLFFKLYDPVKEELRYVGRLFVKDFGKPSDILMKLNEMAGYGREEQIILYEEIKFEPRVMCEPIDTELSYRENQLEDGDIICFQKAIRLPDVPSYLTYLHKNGSPQV